MDQFAESFIRQRSAKIKLSAIHRSHPSVEQQENLFKEKQKEIRIQDFKDLAPDWPVPYQQFVTYYSRTALSMSLVDILGETIQLNLFFLEGDYANSVLLGGSSRISYERKHDYGCMPSNLTAEWIDSAVVPWLIRKGYDTLFVRAFFKSSNVSAQEFFSAMQFCPVEDPGPPYMGRKLLVESMSEKNDKEFPNLQPVISEVPCSESSEYYQAYSDFCRVERDYFSILASIDSVQSKQVAYDQLDENNQGISVKLFRHHWNFAKLHSSAEGDVQVVAF